MRVSLRQIQQLIDSELPPVEELIDIINRQLGGVEDTYNIAKKYEGAVIVRVAACQKHPDADRLSIVQVDDRGKTDNVPRDDDGYVQVVCGAPNVHAGMTAVWLPPGSVVPASIDDDEPFRLEARKLRGVLSQGMLAAADELAIGHEHDGILEVKQSDLPLGTSRLDDVIGQSFAKVFGLDDYVLEIENKMFTHRPDLFGQLGVAREISAILQDNSTLHDAAIDKEFQNPSWYQELSEHTSFHDDVINVFNDAVEKTPRLMIGLVKGVQVAPSPLWLQCELIRLGARPVNTVVDVTNYVMLMTSQPVHAYDYAKIRGNTIGARMATENEAITLLDGKQYTLSRNDIVIADAEGPVALAGIMGGYDSQVTTETTDIVIECANFDMYTVRRSSMRHGLFTDAVTRFTKGQSPLQVPYVMQFLLEQIQRVAGGQQERDLYDVPSPEGRFNDVPYHQDITVSVKFINDRLGSQLSSTEVETLLRRTNIASRVLSDDQPDVRVFTPPFWRTDIEIAEDIVEEVGRLYGFERLPQNLPQRSIAPAPRNTVFDLQTAVRERLSRQGANEVLGYSFISKKTVVGANQDAADTYTIINSLSPDLQLYRLTLTPSLLEKVYPNIRGGHDEFALYEIGKGHQKSHGLNSEGVPNENSYVALTYAARHKKEGAAYYYAKQLVDELLSSLRIAVKYVELAETDHINTALTAPFDPERTAIILSVATGEVVGVVGEYAQSVKSHFKLPDHSSGFELDQAALERQWVSANMTSHYIPLSRFPSVERDVCFEVEASARYGFLEDVIGEELGRLPVTVTIRPVDIFQPEDAAKKRITLRFTFNSYEKTLTSEEVADWLLTINQRVIDKCGATVI